MVIMGIFYLIILVGAVIFYVMYKDDLSFYLLLSAVIMLPILFTSLIITKRKLKVSLICKNDICKPGAQCPLILRIENKSVLMVSTLRVTISYLNAVEATKSYLKIDTPVHFLNTDEICLKLASSYCGKIEAKIEKIRIYDLFRLTSMKLKPQKDSASFYVLPKMTAVEPSVINYSNPLSESSAYSKHRPGDDPSEIFGLHEYVPGDRISKVHWKVSAKEDKLIVKDYSLPLGNNIAIFICASNRKDKSPADTLYSYDKAISIASSLGAYLTENEITHTMYITDSVNGLTSYIIDSEESFRMFLMSSISSKLHCGDELSAYKEYVASCESNTASRYSHCLVIASGDANELENTILSGYDLCYSQTVILTSPATKQFTRLPESTQLITLETDDLSILSDIKI